MNFAGKVVLITGASSGIGAAAAVQFAKLGACLSLTGRNTQNLEKVSKECEQLSGKKPCLIKADLTIAQETENIMRETIKAFNKLDVLVNNAGILESGTIENTSIEQLNRLIDINVKPIYYLTMLAVPHLTKTKGNIVNISSVNGLRSFPGVLAYNMSKTAVDQFTRCVALELASKQIRVNSVNPGVTVTNLHKTGGMSDQAYAEFLERSKTTHALGRPGEAREVANAIVFLASDDASFITAVNLPVDGGRHAMCPR